MTPAPTPDTAVDIKQLAKTEIRKFLKTESISDCEAIARQINIWRANPDYDEYVVSNLREALLKFAAAMKRGFDSEG